MRTKYGAKRVGAFDSKKEQRRGAELSWLEKAGQIENLRHHVKIPMQSLDKSITVRTPTGRVMHYEADFTYIKNGQVVIEDVKGYDTKQSQIKRAVVEAFLGIKILIT